MNRSVVIQKLETKAKRKIMHQAQNEDVHCIMGNCDFIAKNVLYSYRLDFLKHVLGFRKESLIHEMARNLNFEITHNSNMANVCQILRKHYLKELCFLTNTTEEVFINYLETNN